jgi:hypothetical protein
MLIKTCAFFNVLKDNFLIIRTTIFVEKSEVRLINFQKRKIKSANMKRATLKPKMVKNALMNVKSNNL